jgi:pyrimidine-nucleoside phosphorylase
VDDGRALAESLIVSGQAKEKFKQCIRLQGGDERVVDDPSLLPAARSAEHVVSLSSGYITDTFCDQFGLALAMLGGGREKKEDSIDHAVGLEFHARIGDRVEKGQPLVTIHYNSSAKLAEAKELIASSFQIGESAPLEKRPLIRRVLGG